MTALGLTKRISLKAALAGGLAMGVLALPGGPVLAQTSDLQILLDRMERLERDIRTLNRQIARAAAPGAASAPQGLDTPAPGAQPAPGDQPVEFTENESALSRVTVRLGTLEQEVRQATGTAESMAYQIDQINARLDKLMGDLEYRLSRLEGVPMGAGSGPTPTNTGPMYPSVSAAPSPAGVSSLGEMAAPTGRAGEQGTVARDGAYIPPKSGGGVLGNISKSQLDVHTATGGAPAGGGDQGLPLQSQMAATPPAMSQPMAQPAPQPAPEPAGVLPEGSPRERYQFAFGLMSQARYGDAEVALKEFIDKHGDDALAGNAWYWLGETHYVRKSFMDAAQTFFQAYKIAPEGAKAADSLLKLGMSMANLDKAEEACTTFGKLRKEFTDLKPSIERTLNREVKRLKCQ